ncbi:MAG: hypothetical protein HHJ14_05095 [Cellulomonas sp.]|nr:hypothetical protein [Cellulomonas sp.]
MLVLAGWATRWREHPPPLLWGRHRVLRSGLPRPYRAWTRDDVEGLWFPLTMNLALPFVALWLAWGLASPRPFDRRGMSAMTVMLVLVVIAQRGRALDTGRRMYRVAPRDPVPALRPRDEPRRATR